MTAIQVYEEAIKPLSMTDKLAIARLILNEIAPEKVSADTPQEGSGFDYLKRILPQIERITFTDQDLAGVSLNGRKS